MIPDWIDLVIWGNEHECKTSLAESLVGTFRIYQPGSSVATSLVQGESLSNPKNMGILEIKARQFRLKTIPYTQVRTFLYDDIDLCDNALYHLNPNDLDYETKSKSVLVRKVTSMIDKAKECAGDVVPYYRKVDAVDHSNCNHKNLMEQVFSCVQNSDHGIPNSTPSKFKIRNLKLWIMMSSRY